jgi:hypothetical protein
VDHVLERITEVCKKFRKLDHHKANVG